MAARTRLGCGGLVLLLVLPFLSIRIPWVRDWMLDKSLHDSVLTADWRIRIDSVSRFDPWGLRMQGLHLVHRGEEAERDWAMAQYYDGRKYYGSARYYYQELIDDYPTTSFAQRARRRLEEIRDEPDEPPKRFGWLTDAFEEDD